VTSKKHYTRSKSPGGGSIDNLKSSNTKGTKHYLKAPSNTIKGANVMGADPKLKNFKD
jgi:hypothetical protein